MAIYNEFDNKLKRGTLSPDMLVNITSPSVTTWRKILKKKSEEMRSIFSYELEESKLSFPKIFEQYDIIKFPCSSSDRISYRLTAQGLKNIIDDSPNEMIHVDCLDAALKFNRELVQIETGLLNDLAKLL